MTLHEEARKERLAKKAKKAKNKFAKKYKTHNKYSDMSSEERALAILKEELKKEPTRELNIIITSEKRTKKSTCFTTFNVGIIRV